MKLTEAIIKTAEIKPAIYYLWDSDIKGFGVKIIPNGKKKYFLKYRPKNSINQRWYIFGEVGIMKLVTAREEAIKLWGLISSGEDPQADKKEKRTATSLIEFYSLFIKDYVEVIGAKLNYRRSIEYCWNDYIKPALGHKAILDINERDIERIHNALSVIGWVLCYGFINNCIIAPYFDVGLVEWEQLLTSLGIMLGISGVRDIGIERSKQDVRPIKKI